MANLVPPTKLPGITKLITSFLSSSSSAGGFAFGFRGSMGRIGEGGEANESIRFESKCCCWSLPKKQIMREGEKKWFSFLFRMRLWVTFRMNGGAQEAVKIKKNIFRISLLASICKWERFFSELLQAITFFSGNPLANPSLTPKLHCNPPPSLLGNWRNKTALLLLLPLLFLFTCGEADRS